MKIVRAWLCLSTFVTHLGAAGEVSISKQAPPLTIEDDRWRFTLAVPGFMANIDGDSGVGRAVSNLDVGFDKILPRIDMVWATRLEASKGRFGIMGELIYLSLSDGVGSRTAIKKVDARVDQYLTDFTIRWRIAESERGYVDLLAGARYTNLHQAVTLQPNEERIEQIAQDFTAEVSDRLRERIEARLSERRLRNALAQLVRDRVTDRLGQATGPDQPNNELPVAPVAAPEIGELDSNILRLVRRREQALVATAAAELRQAAAAEAASLRAAVAAERARLQARAAALRQRVNARIATAQSELENEVERLLKKKLTGRYARTDDWLDPYVGIRARYNFSSKFYVVGRGDIGGFGVGSDLMWHAEAAFGVQLSANHFAELGYRAISFDYEDDGLTYDVVTHGVQLTVGIHF